MIHLKTLAVFHKNFVVYPHIGQGGENRKADFWNISGKKNGIIIFWLCFRNTVTNPLRTVENHLRLSTENRGQRAKIREIPVEDMEFSTLSTTFSTGERKLGW